MSPRLVLVGAPGAGKTTVGQLLAQRWGVTFADTDALIEAEAGLSVADIFITQGEPAFRDLEVAVVSAALAEHDGVLSLGGGSVLNAGTRSLLQGQPVAYLTVDATHAAARIGLNRDRPLLLGNVRGQLMNLMSERAEHYASVAQWTVDTSSLSPDEVADVIETHMGAK